MPDCWPIANSTTQRTSLLLPMSGQWIDLVHGRRPPRGIVLDMDSSVSPTHGEQEMSVWNGHYACAFYHPLFVFNHVGYLEMLGMLPGNVHSADCWDGVLKPVVARYQGKVSRLPNGGGRHPTTNVPGHLFPG